MRNPMREFGKLLGKVLVVVLLGGFLGGALVRLAPGFGVDEEELDSRLSQESIQTIRDSHAQKSNLVRFYARYLGQLLQGNLGYSETLHQPVRQLLAERFPETLKSVGLGLAFGWTAGLALALLAVMSRSVLVDVATGLFASLLLCIPAAVIALLFLIAQAPGRLIVGLIVFPKVFHYARNLLQESASLPHVLTARAKGLGTFQVILRHIIPVMAPQLFALAGVSVSIAFAATIPVEVLCDLPGIGQLAWKAAMSRDLELLVNLTILVTLITLLANSAAEMAARPMQRGEA